MKVFDILTESLSRIAFHYTSNRVALDILKSGFFQLSSSLGSVEQQYSPKGYPYFLSTTRTRRGGFHNIIGDQAAMFVLDGNWFNARYISKPVDYWENRNPSLSHYRDHEAEDRVFSKNPTISIDGITDLHLYCSIKAEPAVKAWTRQAIIAAKKRGINVYFYTDPNAWRNFDQRKLGDIGVLIGKESTYNYTRRHRGYLIPWLELMQATDKSQLSKQADSLRYSLQYFYDKQSAVGGLSNDLSNSRKPDTGPDRKNAIKILRYMQQHNLVTIGDFVNHLADKWKSQ